MIKRVAILHFNILEKYPPTMNFIHALLDKYKDSRILLYTSQNSTRYKSFSVNRFRSCRFGTISPNPLIRYISYILFNFLSFVRLVFFKPDVLFVFESISVFPAKLYSFQRKCKIHLHYHEYISPPEKKSGSFYMRLLYYFEQQLLPIITTSHTNHDRKALFLTDNPKIKSENVFVFPNFPPVHWWEKYGKNKIHAADGILSLVYVGALDIETMFLEKVLNWVKGNSDTLQLTFFSQQYNNETMTMIKAYACENINFYSPVDYYDLPNELIKFDVGLVLYNGHIPNYIYNVPNKVYEYLSCGLPVLTDRCLKTTCDLKLPGVFCIDFNSIELFDLSLLKNISNVDCHYPRESNQLIDIL